jgi:osmoprotectant transport system permease protein
MVLEDPRRVIPPYDAVLLIAPKRAGDQALLQALQPLVGAIDVAMMREANLRAIQADGSGGASPEQAARWLSAEIEKKTKR